MRVKQLWINLPVLAQIKLVWDRITATRLTLLYFIFSLLHCLVQLAFQSEVFVLNDHAEAHLHFLLDQANSTNDDSFPLLRDTLRMCSNDMTEDSCITVWDGTPQFNLLGQAPAGQPNADKTGGDRSPLSFTASTVRRPATAIPGSSGLPAQNTRSAVATAGVTSPPAPAATSVNAPAGRPLAGSAPAPSSGTNAAADDTDSDDDDDGVESDDDGEDEDDEDDAPAAPVAPRESIYKRQGQTPMFQVQIPNVGPAQVSPSCAASLNYPVFALQRTEREDGAFIAFHIWVLGMSIVAILNESIPHTIASFLTHMMSTGWAGFQLYHSQNFKADYHRVITNGACSGLGPLLSDYWIHRRQVEIPSLVLNIVALGISAFLSYKLLKNFGWNTYKRIGASLDLKRQYNMVLTLSIVIQLSLFFIVVTVALWVDQIENAVAKHLADHRTAYEAVSIITILMIVPWVLTGWFAPRREYRWRMNIFLLLSLLYVCSWTLQFLSHTFLWEFKTWPFFSVMVVVSLSLTMMTLVLGAAVRIGFGKGLPQVLSAHEELPGADFVPYYANDGRGDEEKIQFPPRESPVPTFHGSVAQEREPQQRQKGANLRTLPTFVKAVPRYAGLFGNKEPAKPAPAMSRSVWSTTTTTTEQLSYPSRSNTSSSSAGGGRPVEFAPRRWTQELNEDYESYTGSR